MAREASERSRDFERFVTFIDAIVAIAITLLILPLVDLATNLDGRPVAGLVRDHLAEIGAFLLSFAVIANAWFAQHRAIGTVIAQDVVVNRLLMLWTLTIVILPFPTALVAQSGHEAITKILYIGTMALTSAVLAVLCWAIGRKRAIRDTDSKPNPLHAINTTVGFLVALVITLIFPRTGYYPLLILLLPDLVIGLWRRTHTRRP